MRPGETQIINPGPGAITLIIIISVLPQDELFLAAVTQCVSDSHNNKVGIVSRGSRIKVASAAENLNLCRVKCQSL